MDRAKIYTPDDIMAGRDRESPVVVFDDDHYYMGGVVTEMLRLAGLTVTLITPAKASFVFTQFTSSGSDPRRLLELERHHHDIEDGFACDEDGIEAACVHTGRSSTYRSRASYIVTSQMPEDDFIKRSEAPEKPGRRASRVIRIGIASLPARSPMRLCRPSLARELDAPQTESAFKRERIFLAR